MSSPCRPGSPLQCTNTGTLALSAWTQHTHCPTLLPPCIVLLAGTHTPGTHIHHVHAAQHYSLHGLYSSQVHIHPVYALAEQHYILYVLYFSQVHLYSVHTQYYPCIVPIPGIHTSSTESPLLRCTALHIQPLLAKGRVKHTAAEL